MVINGSCRYVHGTVNVPAQRTLTVKAPITHIQKALLEKVKVVGIQISSHSLLRRWFPGDCVGQNVPCWSRRGLEGTIAACVCPTLHYSRSFKHPHFYPYFFLASNDSGYLFSMSRHMNLFLFSLIRVAHVLQYAICKTVCYQEELLVIGGYKA